MKIIIKILEKSFYQLVIIYSLLVLFISTKLIFRYSYHMEIFALILALFAIISINSNILKVGDKLNNNIHYISLILALIIIFIFRIIPYFNNSIPLGYDTGIYKYIIENGLNFDKWLVSSTEPGFFYFMQFIKDYLSTDFILTYLIRQKLIKKLIKNSIRENFLILDIGCGNGYYLDLLKKYNPDYTGIDLSSYSINKLKKKHPRLNFYCVNYMQFKDKRKFDLIIMSEVLEHIENESEILNKIYNSLKKSGKLILSVPYDPKLWSNSDEIVNHKRRYAKNYLKMIIEKNGFRIDKIYCYGFPLLRIYWILKKNFMKNTSIKEIKYKKSTIKKILFKIINKIFLIDLLLTNTNKGVGLITVCSKNFVK